MIIHIKNEYGSIEAGGGNHPSARVLEIRGLGLPSKETKNIVFSGQAGNTLTNVRDMERVITLKLDFYGGQREIEKIYRLIYHEAEILFCFGERRRKIKGICVNPEEVEKIIFGTWYSIVLQFRCSNPYFNDFYNTKIPLYQRTNLLPNLYEENNWYINLPAVATERVNKSKVINYGDTIIYPVIYITNTTDRETESELFGIILQNETTGEFIKLEYNPKPSEQIIIDLPNRKIIGSNTEILTNYISDDTFLENFFLKEGENIISVENLNVNQDISTVMEYNNNYAMAVIG